MLARLTDEDRVAIVAALRLYQASLMTGDDGDPQGNVGDVEHVSLLIERLEKKEWEIR